MRRILFVLFTVISFSASAQTTAPVLKFGFLSYDAVLRSMPDYAIVEANMALLQEKYAAEQKRVEDEFNRKYEEFLEGQRDFAPTILQKRQTELQELMTKNIQFRQEAERLMRQAEQDALVPLNNKISEVVKALGRERGFLMILNTDGDALQYVDMEMGEDLTNVILSRLR